MFFWVQIVESGTALTSVGASRGAVVVLCDPRFGGFKAGCGNPEYKRQW